MSYVAIASQYIEDVLRGRIVACEWVKLACERQKRDLKRNPIVEVAFPYRFDEDAANRICKFIEKLPHTKGKWARERQRIKLEPWQCFILTTVFGWLHVETGMRRFRRAYEEVARKNAKSTKSSGIALYLFGADGEAGAEVYSAATTRDQAKIVFDDARAMALREPDMCAVLGIDVLQHQMIIEDESSKFLPLSAEGSTLDGLNVHGGIIDELHAHKTRAVFDVIDSATGSRDQSLLWMITTAGTNRSGICYEQRIHVTKILKGTVTDETFFGIIFTLDDGDDWRDPAVWIKANPNLNVSVFMEDMEMACRKAVSMASAVGNFLTKRLNVWVNADSAWMNMLAWAACADSTLRIEDFEGEDCIVSHDLASKVDIAAKMRLFSREIDGVVHYYGFGRYFLNEEMIEKASNSQYAGWARTGQLIATPGNVTDFSVIEDDLLSDAERFNITEAPYDPFQATQFSQRMVEAGLPMIEVGSTVKNFSEPMKWLEALVLQGRFHHDGDPVLEWMISNVVCHRDAKENIFPRKEREENKIDGAVALLMCLNRAVNLEASTDAALDDFINSPIHS
ncbi:MAG TPA: terminase TerL endonuclease subunit [Ochrobactrum sp.]|nr:terminase TerL endonuclease subunit [Ochrobactrum sp.]